MVIQPVPKMRAIFLASWVTFISSTLLYELVCNGFVCVYFLLFCLIYLCSGAMGLTSWRNHDVVNIPTETEHTTSEMLQCLKVTSRPVLLCWNYNFLYRVSQEKRTKFRESVSYVKLYRYNPKHLYPKLNGCGDNGQRKVWTSCISAYCTSTAV